ncbi:MAG TPA: hypothetical protein VFH33_04480 [Candidatus Krumholzibacteria bacterium]|nr:hypothetical protein [Candidatus Krumholzibacteria bacterium]
MRKVTLLSALLPLILIVACSDDDSTVAPPPPPSLSAEDQQIVDHCKAMRDALEAYATTHSGTYGDYYIHWNDLGISSVDNPYSGELEPSGARAAAAGQIGVEAFNECENPYAVIGYRITGYGRDHMLITLESLGNVPSHQISAQDATIANAFLVLDTAKRFAADNHGACSTDVAGDTDTNGKTLQDHLPNGMLLENGFTLANTEPQDGVGLATPGAVGYLGADSGSGIIDSFTIEAYGCNGDVILTLSPTTAYGDVVWYGAYTRRFIIETFAHAAGHYPHDLDTETTPGGKTVFDLMTEMTYDHVPYFENWYTHEHYVPTLGAPTGKFTIGYQPIETAGVVTDYVITGRGAVEEIVRLGPYPYN